MSDANPQPLPAGVQRVESWDDEAREVTSSAAPVSGRRAWLRSPLASYKQWVRAHPGLVSNLDWLLYLGLWNPGRTTTAHSELAYELWHAVVGLLSVWHTHVIDEATAPVQRPTAALWLDALAQLETIIELRAVHVEEHGRVNRYSPLAALEFTKALLKMAMWGQQYAGHLFLRNPGPEDLDQFESEQGLADVMAGLERLRKRYTVQSGDRGSFLTAWWRRGGQDGGSRSKEGSAASRRLAHGTHKARMGADLVWLAELLYIWRPFLYVMLLRRCGRGSWRPWVASLAVDLLSMHFTRRGKTLLRAAAAGRDSDAPHKPQHRPPPGTWSGHGPPPPSSLLSLAIARSLSSQPWSAGEAQELQDRRRKLLLYLVRSPMLDVLIRPVVEAVCARTAAIPLLGSLTAYSAGLLDTLTYYYVYTAGS